MGRLLRLHEQEDLREEAVILFILSALALAQRPDLNAMTVDELAALPGVGPVRAEAIVEHRERLGGFLSLDRLSEVPAVGAATLAVLHRRTRLETSSTSEPTTLGAQVDINTADAELLTELPGVSSSLARAIVADRSRSGPFADCTELSRIPAIGPATLAAIADQCTAQM